MRHIIFTTVFVIVTTYVFGQAENKNLFTRFYTNHLKTNVEQKKLQLFVELSPQFFAYGGYGGGIGCEFSRFQAGFISLKTPLKPNFRDAIFENAQKLTIPKNAAAELFTNIFLRKDRKGLYAGAIYSYDWYSVIDDKTQQKEDFTKQYLVARVGFRWFPLQEYFYIDGGYGVSFNLSNANERMFGESRYQTQSRYLTFHFSPLAGQIFTQFKNKKNEIF
ncbi:MAG: hypothetical protein HC817_01715 [Saprospiraceae bacterium]|nr:hypothetical protein [Saprospiraceae bacterium]